MGKIAYVFAGQGAQAAGMGKSLYAASPAARAAMDRLEKIRPGTLAMCFYGELAELSRTINTQPCLFMVDYACAVAAREAGICADMAAGFSLGEVAAAAFSGLMDEGEAFRLVIRRAELMQVAAERNPGRMAAILRLTADQVAELAGEMDGVYPVNFNCPGQTVVACASESYDAFVEKVAALRGRAMPLNVSGAFHSPFMDEASDGLMAYIEARGLSALQAPTAIPLYANLTAQPYPLDWQETLARQVNRPVRWHQTIEHMRDAGATAFIELGCGTTLSGLVRKIDAELLTFHIEDETSLNALRNAHAEGLL